MKLYLFIIFTAMTFLSCSEESGEKFQVDGVDARIILSKGYSPTNKGKLLIYIPGNGQNNLKQPTQGPLKYLLESNYSYACIDIQDESKPPFTNHNSGWGNEEAYRRVLSLYKHLIDKYGFDKQVIIAGGSMGGLTMGQIITREDIPVKYAIGIGAVPSLQEIWNNAPERRPAIRNSYALDIEGKDDAKMDSVFKVMDWYQLVQKYDKKLVDVFLYYGEDKVFHRDFGGIEFYNKLKGVLEAAGSRVVMRSRETPDHADASLYEFAMEDKIYH